MRSLVPALGLVLAVMAMPVAGFAATGEGLICPIPQMDTARLDRAPAKQCEAIGYATCPVPISATQASFTQPMDSSDETTYEPRLLTRSQIRAELDAVKVSHPVANQRVAALSDEPN